LFPNPESKLIPKQSTQRSRAREPGKTPTKGLLVRPRKASRGAKSPPEVSKKKEGQSPQQQKVRR